jgi:hypothetical protein
MVGLFLLLYSFMFREDLAMNRKNLLAALVVTVTVLSATQCGAEQAKKKQGSGVLFTYDNGTQWLSWGRSGRLMYVVGFLSGWRRGLFELAVDYADCDDAAAEKQGLFTGASTEQLVDSADKFYSDPINRQVTVPDALRYLLDQVAGTPASALQKRLEEIRRVGTFNKRAADE